MTQVSGKHGIITCEVVTQDEDTANTRPSFVVALAGESTLS